MQNHSNDRTPHLPFEHPSPTTARGALSAARRWSPRTRIRAMLCTHLRVTWRPLWRMTPNVARAWQALVLSALICAGRAAQPAYAQAPYPTPVPLATGVTAIMDGNHLWVTGTDADDSIAITSADGNVKINGADPSTGAFSSADVAQITIDSGAGNDLIDVSAVTPPLFGNGPMFEIMGAAGDDTVNASVAGYAWVDGGAGSDVLQVTADGEIVLTDAGMSINGYDRATFNGFEEAVLIGGASDNRMWAQDFGGSVTFVGGVGSDTFHGTANSDVFDAGTGENVIVDQTDGDSDQVRYNADADMTLTDLRLYTADTMTTFNGFIETALLIGGPGANTIDASAWSGSVTIEGGAGDDMLRGGANDDVIEGGDGDDRLEGGAGDDTLRGGAGDDVLHGAAGDDTLFWSPGDLLDGGAGNNTIVKFTSLFPVLHTASGVENPVNK